MISGPYGQNKIPAIHEGNRFPYPARIQNWTFTIDHLAHAIEVLEEDRAFPNDDTFDEEPLHAWEYVTRRLFMRRHFSLTGKPYRNEFVEARSFSHILECDPAYIEKLARRRKEEQAELEKFFYCFDCDKPLLDNLKAVCGTCERRRERGIRRKAKPAKAPPPAPVSVSIPRQWTHEEPVTPKQYGPDSSLDLTLADLTAKLMAKHKVVITRDGTRYTVDIRDVEGMQLANGVLLGLRQQYPQDQIEAASQRIIKELMEEQKISNCWRVTFAPA